MISAEGEKNEQIWLPNNMLWTWRSWTISVSCQVASTKIHMVPKAGKQGGLYHHNQCSLREFLLHQAPQLLLLVHMPLLAFVHDHPLPKKSHPLYKHPKPLHTLPSKQFCIWVKLIVGKKKSMVLFSKHTVHWYQAYFSPLGPDGTPDAFMRPRSN